MLDHPMIGPMNRPAGQMNPTVRQIAREAPSDVIHARMMPDLFDRNQALMRSGAAGDSGVSDLSVDSHARNRCAGFGESMSVATVYGTTLRLRRRAPPTRESGCSGPCR